MAMETPRGKVAIYGCGGCGQNIAARYSDMAGQETPGAAILEPYFIDTSLANLKEGMNKDRFFLMEAREGSGKVRTENRTEISRAVLPILQKFPPGDLNVVVFSGSGGTGSVAAPYLISKLLEDNRSVVAVVVGGDECERAAVNTVNTLKSLEGIAQKTGKTVMMYYEHLKPTDKRSAIDNRIWMVISALASLMSRRNEAMDLQDLHNFFNFSHVTSAEPRLSALEVYTNNSEANQSADFALAVASLLPNPDAESVTFRPEYLCVGYPEHPLPNKLEALHFVAGVEPIHGMFRNLTKSTDEIVRAKHARVAHDSIAIDADSDGMCF